MFKDTKEGETHSYNDGCGESAHNLKLPQHIEEKFDEKFVQHGGVMPRHRDYGQTLARELKSFIATILDEVKKFCNDEVDYAEKQLNTQQDENMIEYLTGKRNAFNDVLVFLHPHSKDEIKNN